MKTVMQELIEWYHKEHFVKTTFHIQLLNKFESLLEKEKEQIIDAYNHNMTGFDKLEQEEIGLNWAEDYYNQTYNHIRDESEEAFKHFADNADITITFNRNS
jgi:hypothetical protein